ncbi:MAG: DUF3365 domain-containing protein [Polyangiaceae bacterium]|nr:DUF3365 domain-containing protein [Polyangiaceae bacterium]MCE7891049.1 DUF3365 domain-containing protein [Sorangiineae bacterium PRO1]MCL4755750.1 DUF3365 domain-containing protein [Myxococcales bacterium]
MWIRVPQVALVLPLVLGCQSGPKRLDPVPKEHEARVTKAQGAIGELKKTLSGRLQEAIKSGGHASGIEVCATEAGKLTADLAAKNGVEIGRSSHKLRNEQNAPRPWVKAYLSEVAGKPAKDVKPAVYDLGDKLGVVEPLPTQALCVSCHGAPEGIPAEVKQKLGERYPKDQATGFAEGDLRGVAWVELAK